MKNILLPVVFLVSFASAHAAVFEMPRNKDIYTMPGSEKLGVAFAEPTTFRTKCYSAEFPKGWIVSGGAPNFDERCADVRLKDKKGSTIYFYVRFSKSARPPLDPKDTNGMADYEEVIQRNGVYWRATKTGRHEGFSTRRFVTWQGKDTLEVSIKFTTDSVPAELEKILQSIQVIPEKP